MNDQKNGVLGAFENMRSDSRRAPLAKPGTATKSIEWFILRSNQADS
jgi:hypothetical protein